MNPSQHVFGRASGDRTCKVSTALFVSAISCKLAREAILREYGADEFLVEDGAIANRVHIPGKSGLYDNVLELVGTVILRDSLRCQRPGGIACITGAVGHAWAINGFGPFEYILSTTKLTIYSSGIPEFFRCPD